MKDVKQKIYELTELINKYRKEYYELDAPTISDYEYDSLIHNLEVLEQQYPEYAFPNSPTKLVGYVPSSQFEKVEFENMLKIIFAIKGKLVYIRRKAMRAYPTQTADGFLLCKPIVILIFHFKQIS